MNADVLEARDASHGRTSFHITANSYKIRVEHPDDEFGPDIPTIKTREQAMESMVHIDYRCPKCRNCQDCRKALKEYP